MSSGSMAKTLNSILFLSNRRVFSVAVEKVKVQPTASTMMRKVAADASEATKETGKEVFWMRDPKTGNWIPENHFGEVDVAELREKFLSKKSHS